MNDLMIHNVIKVDRIPEWQAPMVIGPLRPSGANRIRYFFKRYLVNPLIFLIALKILIFVPQPVMRVLSKKRLDALLSRTLIRMVDILGAIAGLMLTSPVFLLVPLLIKLDSRGPVFYKQLRTGINRRRSERRAARIGTGNDRRCADRRTRDRSGKSFYIFKFRTMRTDAESGTGPVWAKKYDPRITAVGAWLRKYHIDEIPQFLNVLFGHMSLVGPRPERPEIISDILKEIPEYQRRLQVKPGITGPAQVFLGYDTCMEDVRRKIQFDLIYIYNQSVRMQILFLILTFLKIIFNTTTVEINLFNLNLLFRENYKSAHTVTY